VSNPTLFLGLGGTGKQALMHLKRLIMDAYGPGVTPPEVLRRYGAGRLPNTAFLCLDSDPRTTDPKVWGPEDELLKAAQIDGAEMLTIEIDANQMRDLYQHPERYPAYREWYDLSLERFGEPKFGCGQTRPWGRYAFFQHYDRIRASLRGALDSLVDTEAVAAAQKMGVKLDVGAIDVFVVFSIAGGTGSGLFLDVAFLLRDLEAEVGRALKVQAVTLLPTAFSTRPTAKIFANSYAALLELEHYSLARKAAEGFPVYWPGRYDGVRKPERIPGPAFQATWLIGSRSRGPDGRDGALVDPERKSELTAMMAEWLFLRSSPRHSAISAQMTADASNYIANEMSETANLPIYDTSKDKVGVLEQSRRYGSFGLSKIFVARSTLHQMAAHRLIVDLLRAWTSEPRFDDAAVEEGVNDVMRRAFPRASESELSSAPSVAVMIAEIAGHAIDEAEAAIAAQTAAESVVRDALEEGGDPRGALSQRLRVIHDEWCSDEGGDPARFGKIAKVLRQRADDLHAQMRDALNQSIGEALKNPGRRVPFARTVLKRTADAFRKVAEECGRIGEDHASQAQLAKQNVDKLLTYLGDEQTRGAGSGIAARVGFGPSDAVMLALARQASRWHGVYIGRDLERQAHLRAKATAESIIRMIELTGAGGDPASRESGLVQQLEELNRNCVAMTERAERRITELERRPGSRLNARIDVGMEAFYVTPHGAAIAGEALREIEVRLLEDPALFVGDDRSPWGLRGEMRGGGEVVLARLESFARRETEQASRLADDALGAFDDQHPATSASGSYVEALRPVVRAATAWLPIPLQGTRDWGNSTAVARTMRLAYRQTHHAAEDRLKNALSGPSAAFVDLNLQTLLIPQGDAVYLTEEIAGFPLSVVPGLGEWRDRAYLSYLTDQAESTSEDVNAGSALHIERDSTRFGSLVLPKPEEVRDRFKAIDLLARSLAVGVVEPILDRGGSIGFARRKTVGFTSVAEEMGPYDRVILTLMQNAHTATELAGQLQKAETAWRKQADGGLRSRAMVLALLNHHLNGADAPLTTTEWKRGLTRTITGLSANYGQEAVTMAEGLYSELAGWTDEAPPGSGFLKVREAA
jgi:hypothetical protein